MMGKSKKIYVTTPVLPQVFKALERADMIALSECTEEEIRPILPCLVRMSLIAPIENTVESTAARKAILKILSGIETVNAMVALLSVDFVTLESDFKKEQQLRQKVGGTGCGGPQDGSVLVQNLVNGLALEFECSEPLKRLRLLLSEIIYVMAQLREPRVGMEWYHKECELFDNQCYFEEVADILSIGVSELPGLLSPGELAETLLHFSNAPHLIARIVANQPDYFKEVVSSLILSGEVQDEDTDGGVVRLTAVRSLCLMNPSLALYARHICVENCRMPGLAIYLTLDAAKSALSVPHNPEQPSGSRDEAGGASGDSAMEIGDVVSFVTGLLLSPDQQQRAWFSLYIKNAQKRKWEQPWSGLSALRTELSERLCALLLFRSTHLLPASQVIPATALLRLYTALKNLPAIKLHEEKEVAPLVQLITCQAAMNAAGVRFASTGVCALIACPQLIASPEHERRAADWIKWLLKEEGHFSGGQGVWSSSFGALLLLVAIHFHVGQVSAVLDLVSAALGMKVATRPNNLTRIRHIITHEVFTESVVTLIASKVSVTRGLNASLPGFLPVHCVYHLLRSRMFTRHKVNIKNWIYRQICSSQPPMHPVLPQLVEVFVRSVLGSGVAPNTTNDPITQQEILAVFQLSSFQSEAGRKQPSHGIRRSGSQSSRPRLRSTANHRVFSRTNSVSHSKTATLRPASSSSDVEAMLVDDEDKPLIIDSSMASSPGSSVHTKDDGSVEVTCVMTSQLLLLYYLLLYEDLRLSSSQQMTHQLTHYTYSPSLFSQLPIRYLLSRAQRDQAMYGGLFSGLLKLLAHHYPQLCLVEDWLYRPPQAPPLLATPRTALTSHALAQAMTCCSRWPGLLAVLLERCRGLASQQLWTTAAAPLTAHIRHLLPDSVPRTLLDKYVLVWRRLNSIYPRRLWAMTVEGLRDAPLPVGGLLPPSRRPLTEDDLVLDPLHVLRCDPRVFRRAPILQLVEYILRVYLLSSRTFLVQHQQSTAAVAAAGAPSLEEERDKLRGALILTQESAAVQILLESTLLDHHNDKNCSGLNLQEVQSVVFSYLHQAFIRDTTLAKLVHFQGYPRSLIGPVVQGVPSMHIAVGLNWIPELLQLPHYNSRRLQPQLTITDDTDTSQQHSLHQLLFTLELTARLALQNAMPSTMSIARLVINVLSTLICVLSSSDRLMIVRGSLESLVCIGRAFPALLPDLVNLLVTCARLTRAHAARLAAPAPGNTGVMEEDTSLAIDGAEPMICDDASYRSSAGEDSKDKPLVKHFDRKRYKYIEKFPKEDVMALEVTKAFRKLVDEAAMSLKIY